MSLETLKAPPGRPPRPRSDAWRAETRAARSDFDLNPGASRWTPGPLKPAAVLVPIIAGPDGATVLLTRRADSLAQSHRPDRLSGRPAGPRRDGGRGGAARGERGGRSRPGAVEVLGLGDAYETGTGFLVTPVVGWIDRLPPLTASPDEVAEVFEAPGTS